MMSTSLTLVSFTTICSVVRANAWSLFSESAEIAKDAPTTQLAAAFFTGLALGVVATAVLYKSFYLKKVEIINKPLVPDITPPTIQNDKLSEMPNPVAKTNTQEKNGTGKLDLKALDLEKRAASMFTQANNLRDQAAVLRDQKSKLPGIIESAKTGNISALEDLIDNNFDLTKADEEKKTALHHAAINGHPEFVKRLLKEVATLTEGEKSIDVNAQDGKGNTALHYAVESKREETITLLISSGAKFDIPNVDGKTAQKLAEGGNLTIDFAKLSDPAKNKELKKFLDSMTPNKLKSSTSIKAEEAQSTAPAKENELKGVLECASAGDIKGLKALSANNSDLSVLDPESKNALHIAATAGKYKFINALESEASEMVEKLINNKDAKQNTPLHCALLSPVEPKKVAEALIAAGAQFDIAGAGGKTAQELATFLKLDIDFSKPKDSPKSSFFGSVNLLGKPKIEKDNAKDETKS